MVALVEEEEEAVQAPAKGPSPFGVEGHLVAHVRVRHTWPSGVWVQGVSGLRSSLCAGREC